MNAIRQRETRVGQPVTVHCPQCQAAVEVTGENTMVYCVRCRKWCRAAATADGRPQAIQSPPKPRVRRDNRCH